MLLTKIKTEPHQVTRREIKYRGSHTKQKNVYTTNNANSTITGLYATVFSRGLNTRSATDLYRSTLRTRPRRVCPASLVARSSSVLAQDLIIVRVRLSIYSADQMPPRLALL
jgi:hypothetical protein